MSLHELIKFDTPSNYYATGADSATDANANKGNSFVDNIRKVQSKRNLTISPGNYLGLGVGLAIAELGILSGINFQGRVVLVDKIIQPKIPKKLGVNPIETVQMGLFNYLATDTRLSKVSLMTAIGIDYLLDNEGALAGFLTLAARKLAQNSLLLIYPLNNESYSNSATGYFEDMARPTDSIRLLVKK
ncbi:MAG: hypothetical protein WAV40_01665 [Microgenomates group bacterium]